jgi:hypothetical protein
MLSMSSSTQQPKLDRAVTDSSVSYHNAPPPGSTSTPPQVQEVETTSSETPTRVITPIGTLSIKAAVSEPNGEEKEEHAAPVVGKLPSSPTPTHPSCSLALKPKKVTSAKKKSTLGAKKLSVPTTDSSSTSSSNKGQDFRIETFESVEKKQQRAAAEEEDFALAQKLQNDEIAKAGGNGRSNAGVSRISSLLQEEEKSIYRSPYAATPPTPPSSGISSSSPYASLSSNNYSSTSAYSSATPATASAPGASDKFSKSKGISSDQYFGRDLAEQEEHRKTLSKYSNSTSISSDMLYGQQQGGNQGYSTRESDNLGGLDFDRLKDSVKGFFDELR